MFFSKLHLVQVPPVCIRGIVDFRIYFPPSQANFPCSTSPAQLSRIAPAFPILTSMVKRREIVLKVYCTYDIHGPLIQPAIQKNVHSTYYRPVS